MAGVSLLVVRQVDSPVNAAAIEGDPQERTFDFRVGRFSGHESYQVWDFDLLRQDPFLTVAQGGSPIPTLL